MTLPCVVGPYTGVHCRLTLLSSRTRVDPRIEGLSHNCCADERRKNGYPEMPDDPRFVSIYAATEAIATSSGQNDAGMFELNFRDERYLPFEFAGAVSRWRIELPQENNQFDLNTLSDLALHLNYTAREGGEVLRRVANEEAQRHLPGDGWRFFDVKHEFPNLWHLFTTDSKPQKHLALRLGRNMFAFIPGQRDLAINRVVILFEAPGAEPSAHHVVEFLAGPSGRHVNGDKCKVESLNCIASADWPGFYHGVLDLPLGLIRRNGEEELGAFRFQSDVGEISRVYIFCSYTTA
jgi:Tc toxin complex TcA C-terminal TcB-binding domain